MREEVKILVNEYELNEKMIDFMGFNIDNIEDLQFHHLIIPKRLCDKMGYGDGYYTWNCAPLTPTAHSYLHTLELYDEEKFYLITNKMITMKSFGIIDYDKLEEIHNVLVEFENEFIDKLSGKGKPIIKEEYYNRYFYKKPKTRKR